MSVTIYDPGDEYVLNHCVKHLSRAARVSTAGEATPAGDALSGSSEAWRFPIIGLPRTADAPDENLVTFVFKSVPGDARIVQVLGTFGELFRPVPMTTVNFNGSDTGYRSLSIGVPKGQVHTYKYFFEDRWIPDPINPQRVTLGNGQTWSRFFTDGFMQPVVLEPWEVRLLYRLVEQMLPFRSKEADNFLNRYYFGLNREQRKAEMPKAFRLDGSVGEVNAIDKLLAREETHRLVDYRTCLRQIDRALRRQNPFMDPYDMPAEYFIQLYEHMAASGPGDHSIDGWDYGEYDNPAFFLYILRRHAVTAAFSHPRYAGNVGAAGWAYLSERYSDDRHATKFDWRAAIEPPLGTNIHYR